MRRLIFMTVAFLSLVFGLTCSEAGIPEDCRNLLLQEKWQALFETLKKDDSLTADPVARLLMAHASFATNKNNESLILFGSVSTEEDLKRYLEWSESLAKDNPQKAVAHYFLGDALARTGKYDEAIRQLDRALENSPQFGLAMTARGVLLTLKGNKDRGLIDLITASRINPDLAGIWAELGIMWVMSRAPEGAIEALAKALKQNPNFALARLANGVSLYGQGRFEEALKEIEVAKAMLPYISDMADYDREMLFVSFNRFLHDVNLITNGERPGTTLEMKSFKQSEVDIGNGKKMNVYIIRPENDYNSVRTAINDIAGDLSKRIDKPIDQLHLHVEAHGWGSGANDLKVHGALLAGAGGRDGVVVLDLPEFRGYPETRGLAQKAVGMATAAYKWEHASDLAARKMAMTGAAINVVTTNPASLFGHSGSSEAAIKQGEILFDLPKNVRDNLKWNNIITAAQPFSQTFQGFKNVEVTNYLTQRVDGAIYNFHTTQEKLGKFIYWSNPVSGEPNKVINLNLTANNKAISHTDWTKYRVNGVMNPSLTVSAEILRGGSSADGIRTIARTYDTVGSLKAFWNTNLGLTTAKIISPVASGLGAINFKDIDGALSFKRNSELSKRDPASVPVFVLENTTPDSLNRVLQNLDKATPSFTGFNKRILLQGSGSEVRRVEKYLTQHGIAVSMSRFSRDLPQLQIVANKTVGHYTGPHDAIVMLDKKAFTKAPSSTEFTFVSNDGGKIHTTVKHFLQGDIPTTKLDHAFASEFAVTQQFRQRFGKPMTWHEWFHGTSKVSVKMAEPAKETFKAIPVTSFGQDKIADVWHWDASQINPSSAAQRISSFARSMGENEVMIRTNDPLKAEGLKDSLKRFGLNSEIVRGNPEGVAKLDTVVAGMSLTTKNPVVVGLYDHNKKPEPMFTSGVSFKSNLPDQRYLFRSNDDMGNLLPLVQKITKQSGSGRVLLMGGDDLYTYALKMQFADRGLEAIKTPPLPGTIGNINKAKFDALVGVKGAPMPSTFKSYDEYKVPLPPHEHGYNWNQNLDYMEQKGLIKHYSPPQPVRPGGVSMKEFARTWVDRGDWPLVVGFGLGYR